MLAKQQCCLLECWASSEQLLIEWRTSVQHHQQADAFCTLRRTLSDKDAKVHGMLFGTGEMLVLGSESLPCKPLFGTSGRARWMLGGTSEMLVLGSE
jgi:hypothetical protein